RSGRRKSLHHENGIVSCNLFAHKQVRHRKRSSADERKERVASRSSSHSNAPMAHGPRAVMSAILSLSGVDRTSPERTETARFKKSVGEWRRPKPHPTVLPSRRALPSPATGVFQNTNF